MRHRKAKFRLNRFTSWRDATLISMARNVLERERIVTTKNKAMAARPLIEKLITLGRQNSLAARRRAFMYLQDHRLVNLLFNDIAVRFQARPAGYTRILGFGSRRGDNAAMVILELTEMKKKEPKKHKKEKEEAKPGKEEKPETPREKAAEEKKPRAETAVAEKEKPPITKKPDKKFLRGLRNIFKKERDSL
jgi:large subunit ribosomal protein L17